MLHRWLCDSQIRNLHSACVHGVVLALPLCRCVATTVYSPGHGYLAARHSACLCGHASVCVVLCVRSRSWSVFAYRGCDGLAPLTIGGADQALAVAVWIYTTWYLLDDGVFAGCVGTWVYRYTLVQHRSIFATKAV